MIVENSSKYHKSDFSKMFELKRMGKIKSNPDLQIFFVLYSRFGSISNKNSFLSSISTLTTHLYSSSIFLSSTLSFVSRSLIHSSITTSSYSDILLQQSPYNSPTTKIRTNCIRTPPLFQGAKSKIVSKPSSGK